MSEQNDTDQKRQVQIRALVREEIDAWWTSGRPLTALKLAESSSDGLEDRLRREWGIPPRAHTTAECSAADGDPAAESHEASNKWVKWTHSSSELAALRKKAIDDGTRIVVANDITACEVFPSRDSRGLQDGTIVFIEDDRTAGVDAAVKLLHELGVHLDIRASAVCECELRVAVDEHSRGTYIASVGAVGLEVQMLPKLDALGDHDVDSADKRVVRTERERPVSDLVDHHTHNSSPSVGGCGDHSVGEPGPAEGSTESSAGTEKSARTLPRPRDALRTAHVDVTERVDTYARVFLDAAAEWWRGEDQSDFTPAPMTPAVKFGIRAVLAEVEKERAPKPRQWDDLRFIPTEVERVYDKFGRVIVRDRYAAYGWVFPREKCGVALFEHMLADHAPYTEILGGAE